MSHETLVFIAKTVGLFWMMAFFLVVVVMVYWPGRRAHYDRAARSILSDSEPGEGER